MRIHTNWGLDPRLGYRIGKSISIFLIIVVNLNCRANMNSLAHTYLFMIPLSSYFIYFGQLILQMEEPNLGKIKMFYQNQTGSSRKEMAMY